MKLSNRHILIIILLFATALRFYRLSDIPYMHDEFSALSRTEFSSFNQMIEQGVRIDAHPAGIQSALYVWVKLFGKTEWIVKLPFLIMGVMSVWMVYLLAKKWYNETVGLICAAFFSSIQYTIMYSQIARPYISGLFFSLAMVFFWSRMMDQSSKKFWNDAALYISASVLCAYNHHFSLLFSAIVGLSGLFFIPRRNLLKYMLCGLIIFILYLPHLDIFTTQLRTGGVGGWLAKPDLNFFWNYIHYIFNYSIISLFLIICLSIGGIFIKRKNKIKLRCYFLNAIWFLLPLSIGYIYSVRVSPVLQFSVLLFSVFPLFFLLIGHISLQTSKTNLIIVAAILVVNSYALITERKHYSIFYNSPFEHIVLNYINFRNAYPDAPAIIDSHKKITHHYLSRHESDSSFIWYDTFENEAALINYLKDISNKSEYLYVGALSSNPPNTIPIVLEYFPHIINEFNYYGGTTWFFSKTPETTAAPFSVLDFDVPVVTQWHSVNEAQIRNDITNDTDNYYLLDSLVEWSPTFSMPLQQVISHHNNFIDISVNFKSHTFLTEAVLTTTLERDGEVLYFSSSDIGAYLPSDTLYDHWHTAHHSLKLSDIDLDFNKLGIKVFIWNKGKNNFLIDDFRISVRDGNPIIYALYEKIP